MTLRILEPVTVRESFLKKVIPKLISEGCARVLQKHSTLLNASRRSRKIKPKMTSGVRSNKVPGDADEWSSRGMVGAAVRLQFR